MQQISTAMMIALHLAGYAVVYAVIATSPGWPAAMLAALLIWISATDALRFEIPDLASLGLVLGGLLLLPALPVPLAAERLAGAVLWPLAFWAVAAVYLRSRGNDGLGFGDVKLMAGIGLWCGLQATIYVVLAAALSGIAVLAMSALVRPNVRSELSKSEVAFGPFLCLSAWTIWLAGAPP